jgi:hypothetical protein
METVVDKIRDEVAVLNDLPVAEGGLADLLPIKAVYFGDPGIIPASLYPCITVGPDRDTEQGGSTGMDNRDLYIELQVLIDARQYFETNADEAMGDRMLVQATSVLTRWFQRRSKRTLDGTVQNLAVGDTDYRVQERGNVISKSSRTTLIVRKTYARVLD